MIQVAGNMGFGVWIEGQELSAPVMQGNIDSMSTEPDAVVESESTDYVASVEPASTEFATTAEPAPTESVTLSEPETTESVISVESETTDSVTSTEPEATEPVTSTESTTTVEPALECPDFTPISRKSEFDLEVKLLEERWGSFDECCSDVSSVTCELYIVSIILSLFYLLERKKMSLDQTYICNK